MPTTHRLLSRDPGGLPVHRRARRRRPAVFVVLAENAHHGRRRRVLAFLLAGGDDEAGRDVAQAQLLPAQVQRDGEHRVVGDGGAADGLAPARADSWPSRGCDRSTPRTRRRS